MNYTKEKVIEQLERDLKWTSDMQKKEMQRGQSDLSYWSNVAKIEFLEANLKFLKD